MPNNHLINEILPGLYLGSVHATDDFATLKTYGITHVMSLGVKPYILPENLVEKVYISVRDDDVADIKVHFP